jgi:NAD-dependent deacetylase
VWKGMPLDVISSARMLQSNLPAVWEWFDQKREFLENLKPNAAHRAFAEWEQCFGDFTLVTQNVDGLHQKAGSRDVVELHGSVWRARCITCHSRFEIFSNQRRAQECKACGDALRPDVVLFGEVLPPGVFERAAKQAEKCELCFVVGTSAQVYPAASLPEIAKAAGAYVCEINPEETPFSDLCDEVLTGMAGEVLPLFSRR